MHDILQEKAQKQYRDLTNANERLKEVLALPATRIHKDATIQRFEFCVELAWKLMQTVSQSEFPETFGPKNSIRTAAQLGLIEEPEPWFSMIAARNVTTHMYREAVADQVYEQSKLLPPLVDHLLTTVKEKILVQNNLL